MFIFFSSIYLLKAYCGVIILDHCSLYIGVYLYRTCYYNGVLFVFIERGLSFTNIILQPWPQKVIQRQSS